MNIPPDTHYDSQYFEWQASIGEFGGWANLGKFTPFIQPEQDVLDFGCSGGWLLMNLACRRRLGVEVNPAAVAIARKNGVEVFNTTQDVPDESADVIISNHVLEHTLLPLQELEALRPKLRRDGRIVFVVPCETIAVAYEPKNVGKHLYSWSPMCLGNLFTQAGYIVLESKPLLNRWPPKYETLARNGGRKVFDLASRIYGLVARSYSQVRVVAMLEG